MELSGKDIQDFNQAKFCHICESHCKENEKRVRGHCHLTGKYGGAAHNKCNLQCRKPLILPVVFYNLQGYDSHLFIKQLSKTKGGLNFIPSTEEKHISFSKKIRVNEHKSRLTGEQVSINFEI